jgi:hypothetical protein
MEENVVHEFPLITLLFFSTVFVEKKPIKKAWVMVRGQDLWYLIIFKKFEKFDFLFFIGFA